MYLTIKKAMVFTSIALCMMMATIASANSQVIAILEEADTAMRALGGNLDRYNGGSNLDCQEFLMYTDVLEDVQYTDASGIWVDLHTIYVDAAAHAVNAVEGVAQTCKDSGVASLVPGAISDLNYGVARMGINEALEKLRPALLVAAEQPMPTATPEPTMVPEPTEVPTEEMPMPEPTEAPVATPEAPSCVVPASGPWPDCAKNGEPYTQATPVPADGSCVIPESGPWPECAKNGYEEAPSGATTADDGMSVAIPLPADAVYDDGFGDIAYYTTSKSGIEIVNHFNKVVPTLGYSGKIDTRPYVDGDETVYIGVFRNEEANETVNFQILDNDGMTEFLVLIDRTFQYPFPTPSNSTILFELIDQAMYGTDLSVDELANELNSYFASNGFTGEMFPDELEDSDDSITALYTNSEQSLTYIIEVGRLNDRIIFIVTANGATSFGYELPVPVASTLVDSEFEYVMYETELSGVELIEFFNEELPAIGYEGSMSTTPLLEEGEEKIYVGVFSNPDELVKYNISIIESSELDSTLFTVFAQTYEPFAYDVPVPEESTIMEEDSNILAYFTEKSAVEIIEFYNEELPERGIEGQMSTMPLIEEEGISMYLGVFIDEAEELQYGIQIVDSNGLMPLQVLIIVEEYVPFEYEVPVPENSAPLMQDTEEIVYLSDKSVTEVIEFFNTELPAVGFDGEISTTPIETDSEGTMTLNLYAGVFVNKTEGLQYSIEVAEFINDGETQVLFLIEVDEYDENSLSTLSAAPYEQKIDLPAIEQIDLDAFTLSR